MPKLYSPDQSTAQARADDIHRRMCAYDAAYKASAAGNFTTGWAVAAQDMSSPPMGQQPVALNAFWFCRVNAKCLPVLTAAEVAGQKPDSFNTPTAGDVTPFVAQAPEGK